MAALSAGELTTLIEVLQNQRVREGNGEYVDTWVPISREWARMDPVATREVIASGAVGAVITQKISVRDESLLASPHRVRVIDTGDVYMVEAVTRVPADRKKNALCSRIDSHER